MLLAALVVGQAFLKSANGDLDVAGMVGASQVDEFEVLAAGAERWLVVLEGYFAVGLG